VKGGRWIRIPKPYPSPKPVAAVVEVETPKDVSFLESFEDADQGGVIMGAAQSVVELLGRQGDIEAAHTVEELCKYVQDLERAQHDMALELSCMKARAQKAESKVRAQGNLRAQSNRHWRKYHLLRAHQHRWYQLCARRAQRFPP